MPGYHVQVSPTATPEDAAADRRIKEADAASRRRREDAILLLVAIVCLACLTVGVGIVPNVPAASAEKAWTLLGAIVTALLAYFAGTKASSK